MNSSGNLTLTLKQWQNVRQQNILPMPFNARFPPGRELHLANPRVGYLGANTGIT